MSEPNNNTEKRQSELAFDEPHPTLRDLRAIDHRLTGVGRKRWVQVRELVAAILHCGLNDGCRASVDALIDVANRNRAEPIIKSPRTFFRIRLAAIAVGVIVDEPSYDDEGRTFSERSVSAPRIVELLRLTRAMNAAKRKAQRRRKTGVEKSQNAKSGTHLADTWQSPTIALKPLKPNKPNTVDREPLRGDDQILKSTGGADRGSAELDADAIRGIAVRITRGVGRLRSRGDWELALKAAVLTQTLGERWLWDAVEAVRHKRPPAKTPWAYLHRCLDEGAADAGVKFNRALAGVALQLELFADPGQPAIGGERLCTTGRDQ